MRPTAPGGDRPGVARPAPVASAPVYQVKTPAESKYPWDDYKLVTIIPGDKAFQPLSESKCPLVRKP